MNKVVTTLVLGLTTLAMAGGASAQTTNTLRITGATAYRAVTHNAILAMLKPETRVYGYTGSSLGSAARAQFIGQLASDPNIWVNIQCSWSGSLDGIQRVVNRGNSAYDRTDWPVGTNLTAGGTANISFLSQTGPADIAMSDAFQSSTRYTTPALESQIVGVIPFVWVKNMGAPAAISNMTALLAQQLMAAGSVPLSFFSGDPNDAGVVVKVAGRNADSGTRLCAFAETGFGVMSQPVHQRIWTSGNTITNITPYPAETVLGTYYPPGASGYSSGGTLAQLMNLPGSYSAPVPANNRCWLVAAMAINDAMTVNGGNNILTYNGVAYSPDAVRNGKYTFWSYEHMIYSQYVSGNATLKYIADKLAETMLTLDPGSAAIKLDTMNVQRGQEGAPVTEL